MSAKITRSPCLELLVTTRFIVASPTRIFHAGFQPAWPAARMEYGRWQGASLNLEYSSIQGQLHLDRTDIQAYSHDGVGFCT
jgi:hypothetical protein